MSITITKLEQSAFVLAVGDAVFAFDLGSEARAADANAIGRVLATFVSHKHPDHFNASNIDGLGAPVYCASDIVGDLAETKLPVHPLNPGDRVVVGPLSVLATHADHGPISAQIVNLGFVLAAEGKKIFFAGDMRIETQIEPQEFDLLIVPVGDSKVFSPEMALSYAKALGHRGPVIPVHYHGRADREAGQKFRELAGDACEVVVLDVGKSFKLS